MERAFDQAAFAQWLTANSKAGPPLPKTLQRLALSDVDPSRPVVANGILSGPLAAQALERDRDYVQAPAPDKLAALRIAPVTGCSMLLTMAREKSGYDCQTPGQPDGELKFMQYIEQIVFCPLFHKDYDDVIANRFEGDWNNVINTIADFYVGISDSDRETLRQSMRAVAAAASSSPSTVEQICTFFQSTIDSSDRIASFFYYMNVRMVTYVDHGGKNEPDRVRNQAELRLHRVKMWFDAPQWPSQAEAVYRETQSSLADWLDSNSTPVGALPSNWHPY